MSEYINDVDELLAENNLTVEDFAVTEEALEEATIGATFISVGSIWILEKIHQGGWRLEKAA